MRKSTSIILTVTMVLLLAGPVLAGGAKEGIAVHGHWKIEIFEPDGTPVSVTEFENALVSTGRSDLGELMDGRISIGGWMIMVYKATPGYSNTGPCDESGTDSPCVIAEGGVQWSSSAPDSYNLVATLTSSGIELSGTVIADHPSVINTVATFEKSCAATITPQNCPSEPFASTGLIHQRRFTETTLASPPSVQAGQIIQVTVTISFS